MWITTNGKILRDGNTRPPYRPPGWRNLYAEKHYAGQEATVRNAHETTDWFKIGKGVCQGLLSPCLFNLYVEYMM